MLTNLACPISRLRVGMGLVLHCSNEGKIVPAQVLPHEAE